MAVSGLKGMLTEIELRALVETGEVDTIVAVFPDLYGRLVGKRIAGHYFCDEVLAHGMHACDYLLACDMEMDPTPGYRFASWAAGYGDVHCVPDLKTLRRASWLEKTALVICDVYNEKTDALAAVAPRSILRKQIARAHDLGFEPMAGTELEFFIFRETYESAHAKGFDNLEPFGWYIEDYHVLQGTKAEPLIGAMRRHLDASGVPVETSKGEWGPGQHEINVRFASFLEMADRHAIYKQICKEVAHQQGLAITFMAKPDERYAGSSMHLHSSLWKLGSGEAVFNSGKEPFNGDVKSLPEQFRWWVGGLMKHARGSALMFAPNVNSYKRFRAGSFAPTGIAWSYDNRTAGFRIVGRGSSLRIECRMPGADANPYLSLAATLAAGLDGLANRIEPPAMFSGDVYAAAELPRVPGSLPEAIAEFDASPLFKEAFGADVVEHLVHFARTEQQKFEETVTTWERRRYLERA